MTKEYIERPSLIGKLTSSETQSAMREMDGSQAYSFFLSLLNAESAADVVEVGHLREMLSELESQLCGDCPETYTSGYRNGHRNGQIELLRYILQIPDGTSESEDGRKG